MNIRFWNNLTFEEWTSESEKEWDKFISGETTLVLPEPFFRIETDFGLFIQVQMNCLLSEPPGLFVRDSYYGPALKVLVPLSAKPGDKIRIVRASKSGKSLIAETKDV